MAYFIQSKKFFTQLILALNTQGLFAPHLIVVSPIKSSENTYSLSQEKSISCSIARAKDTQTLIASKRWEEE